MAKGEQPEPETVPAPVENNIHEAIAAIYREVGYVHKGGRVDSFGAKYTYAGEADLIAAIRPSMVDHQVYCHVAQILNRESESFTNAKGTMMHHVRLDAMVRFTHGPSGTSIDCMSSGEGIDSGDKGIPKALTGAFKYALRQTFAIETGDDPDVMPSSEQERHNAPQTRPTVSVPNGRTSYSESEPSREPLPTFPTPRGSTADEWTKLTEAIVEKRVTRQAVTAVLDGEFNKAGFERYIAAHAGRSAEILIETAQNRGSRDN